MKILDYFKEQEKREDRFWDMFKKVERTCYGLIKDGKIKETKKIFKSFTREKDEPRGTLKINKIEGD